MNKIQKELLLRNALLLYIVSLIWRKMVPVQLKGSRSWLFIGVI